MLVSVLLAIALPSVLALPSGNIYADFRKATASDARSPCPALNSLANHGILPRSGRNISLDEFIVGLKTGLNVGADFATAIGTFGQSTSPNSLVTLDLNNLGKHGAIEHDNSLSRQDAFFANQTRFHQPTFDKFFSALSKPTVSLQTAANARYGMVLASKKNNPEFTYTAKEVVLSYGETALYLSVMGNPVTGNPLTEYVRIFFQEERLPAIEGWRPSTIETNLATLSLLIPQLQALTPPQEGLLITQNTLTNVLNGRELEGLTPCYLGGSPCA